MSVTVTVWLCSNNTSFNCTVDILWLLNSIIQNFYKQDRKSVVWLSSFWSLVTFLWIIFDHKEVQVASYSNFRSLYQKVACLCSYKGLLNPSQAQTSHLQPIALEVTQPIFSQTTQAQWREMTEHGTTIIPWELTGESDAGVEERHGHNLPPCCHVKHSFENIAKLNRSILSVTLS